MKAQLLLSIALFLVIEIMVTTGCKKGDTNLPPPQHGVIRAKGNPAGLPVSKDIGIAGGELISPDGKIGVLVPAGAVTVTTNFIIQPVINTLPHGVGVSYRLLPEGIHFSLPVTVTFRYSDKDLHGNADGNLDIAYQDSTGIWRQPQFQVIDTIHKILQTDSKHFSDWAIYEPFIIICDKSTIGFNELADLKVREIMSLGGLNGGEITDTLSLDPSYASTKWKLNGQGALNVLLPTSTARYTAPSTYPTPDPVIVSFEIQGVVNLGGKKSKVILIQPITVSDSAFMKFSFKGINYNFKTGLTAISNGSTTSITANGPEGNISFSLTGSSTGSYDFDYFVSKSAIIGLSLQPQLTRIYGITYSVNCGQANVTTEHTPGKVIITGFDEVGGYISGTFSGTIAYEKDCVQDFQPIEGSFRIKRT